MPSPPLPSPPPGDDLDAVADLVARCILALETEGRDAVDAMLAAEPELAERAREQLESLESAGLLMEREAVPEQIGGYRIRSVIGRGGMGEVYLADQTEPVQRRVAIKVIRPGMDTREVLARFAIERQALALFDHPNIAKVYDAGSTEDGRPYLVMEFVDGVPITSYCDDRQLSVRQRVELIAEVCDTVQHAHQRGVLHRDLKPSNILVSDRDGRPWPKIIDFGVAKSTQHRLALETLFTERGQVLGTPEYMSPEQAAHRLDVDTRTDVYSLGCILYEILTGSLPFSSERLRRERPSDLERILLDETPPPPSIRVRGTTDSDTAIAANRRLDSSSLRRALHRDLDWIAMCAIDRDRNRRYAMPADLAADLRRHLHSEAVVASPPSTWYRVSRFMSRHRVAASAGAMTLGALIAGLAISIIAFNQADARAVEALDAQKKEASAREAAEDARELAEANFLAAIDAITENLIRAPGEHLRRFPELADEREAMLEAGLASCGALLATNGDGPRFELLRSQLLAQVASFLLELNRRDQALARILDSEEALAKCQDATELRDAWLERAYHISVQHWQIANQLGDKPTAITEAEKQWALARALQSEFGGAEALLQEARNRVIDTKVTDEDARAEGVAMLEETLPALREELAADTTTLKNRVKNLELICLLGRSFMNNGRVQEALAFVDEAMTGMRALVEADPDNPDLLARLAPVWMQRGATMLRQRDAKKAEESFQRGIATFERLCTKYPGYSLYLGHLASARKQLASAMSMRFGYGDALAEFDKAIALREQICELHPDNPKHRMQLANTLGDAALIGSDYRQLKFDYDLIESISRCERSRKIADELIANGMRNLTILDLRSNMTYLRGRFHTFEGDHTSALPHYERAFALKQEIVDAYPQRRGQRVSFSAAARALAKGYLLHGRPADAVEYAKIAVEIEDGLASDGADYRDGPERRHLARMAAAEAHAALGQQAAAVALAEASLASKVGKYPITIANIADALIAGAKLAPTDQRREVLMMARRTCRLHRERIDAMFGSRRGSGFYIMRARVYDQAAEIESILGESPAELEQLEAAFADWEKVMELKPGNERYGKSHGATLGRLIQALRAGGQGQRAAELEGRRNG